ncbi:hypothetical protein RB628_35270 [Streptomyces sp. ADMS]|uniref:hypothetical protein n=1 Tax=Streptomyces sp. ADMS TaxID=3071415 RepID=UPI00296F84B9|nr:hypothetical protein [Streptomyces sp. ADMS]MDW4910450.1 hypothetical protein [Streptomyces sp. ADMS]
MATPMNENTAPEVLDRLTGLIPMRRIGRPEEAADLVAFPASDRVGFSIGAVYDISGGRATCRRPRQRLVRGRKSRHTGTERMVGWGAGIDDDDTLRRLGHGRRRAA